MYNSLEFVDDFVKAYPAYDMKDRSNSAISICHKVYRNSAHSPLGFLVVGRIVKPATNPDLPPMIGLDDIERVNFGVTCDRAEGSVLWSTYWSVPLNDAWLMGGIHARLPFYLASPRTKDNVTDPQFGFTVTGRELIGLMQFGYELNPNTTLGEVFECKHAAKAMAATFQDYELAVRQAKRKGDWQRLVS